MARSQQMFKEASTIIKTKYYKNYPNLPKMPEKVNKRLLTEKNPEKKETALPNSKFKTVKVFFEKNKNHMIENQENKKSTLSTTAPRQQYPQKSRVK